MFIFKILGEKVVFFVLVVLLCFGGQAVPSANLLSSEPADQESWPRVANNTIEMVFSETLSSLPGVPLKIVEETSLTDAAADFSYSLVTTNVTDDTLVATEDGNVLQDDTWYHIAVSGAWADPFSRDIFVLRGDTVADMVVDLFDYTSLAAAYETSGIDLGRVDLDSSGDVDRVDLGFLIDNWLASDDPEPCPSCQCQPDTSGELFVDVDFTLFRDNPVLVPGPGSDDSGVLHCTVRRKDTASPFMMWYTGGDSPRRIYLATSYDGSSWTKQGLVLTDESIGAHAHMPTVLWDPDAGINGLWKMWYTSGSAYYGLYYATSVNGVTWNKYGEVFAPTFDPATFDCNGIREPTVIYDSDEGLYKLWYWANRYPGPGSYGYVGMGYAESPDGTNWTRVGEVFTNVSLSGAVGPEVLKINGVYYMWWNLDKIYYAASWDGINWEQYGSNPVINKDSSWWDYRYIQAPTCVYDPFAGKLYLWYSGADPGYTMRIGGAWTWFEPYGSAFKENFEGNFNQWTDGGITDWDITGDQQYSGSYSAHCTEGQNDLISDDIDTSDSNCIMINFNYMENGVRDGIELQLYDGTGYDNKFDLANTYPEDNWHTYSTTIHNSGIDSQYFHENFRIKFDGTGIIRKDFWIDDVKVTLIK